MPSLPRHGRTFGAVLSALLFLVWLVEKKSLLAAAAFAFGLAFGSFYLFDTLLRVSLPRGPLGI